ncbi:MAG: hypothetical protein WBO43_03270 [Gemmatimonadota bacterium]
MSTIRGKLVVLLAASLFTAFPAGAQDVSPDQGGTITSLGQPSSLKPYGGISGGGYYENQASDFTAYLSAGIRKDLLSPVMAVAAVQLEGYGGVRGSEADGGLRALFAIPFIRLGFGVDWSFKDGSLPFLMRLSIPFRRGGVITRGGQLTVDWLPARSSFNVGFNFPLGQKWAGKTRPGPMSYPVSPDRPALKTVEYAQPALEPALTNMRETAYWVNRLTVPYFDQTGRRRDQAVAAFTEDIQGMQARLASSDPLFGGSHTATAELLAYHAEVARAFSIALSGEDMPFGMATAGGEAVAEMARAILLEEVLFPYDRLLGVHKKKDTTDDLAFIAMEVLTAWAEEDPVVPADRIRAVQYVFQAVLDGVEAARAQSKEWWGDDRLVWIPLQYGLLPEDHDTQSELDAIIERATGHDFSGANKASYAMGLQFQWELSRGIQRAEDYHVLWIHDYTGLNAQGEPDLISFYMTRNYLRTLVSRVREYDETGHIPTYFIFIDQHYYELKKARMWMDLLERPLEEQLAVPEGMEFLADSLAMVQADLRAAVEGSERLQADAARYGEDWLNNRIKVQVNVTNPADLSYWANSYFPLAGWPDNAIRDHRKISFYDITEEDPYRGSATFSGMGVGEHYVGPNWEDRALVLSGPAALEVKTQARELLVSQGFDEDQIPEPLRPKPFGANYERQLEEYAAATEGGARAMQLHNGTGYLMKPINVAKAILYTLMPPDAVIIDPDSLFHNPLWASMLLGSSLRGVRVIIIHPSQANAPGQAFMTLSRASEMFERMIIAEGVLSTELDAAGGLYKAGLYDMAVDVGDLPARTQAVADGLRTTPWLHELLPAGPELMSVFDDADQIFAEATGGASVEYLADELQGVRRPKLHLKTNFFMNGETLDILLQSPVFASFAHDFVFQQSLNKVYRDEYRDVREMNLALAEPFLEMLRELREEAGPEAVQRSMAYFMVGSSNQDYRSMMMDGEVSILLAHRSSMNGFFDSIGIAAVATYLESVEELNEHLPYITGMKWKISRWIKVSL